MKDLLREKMDHTGWFDQDGAYVLVDGQYGSTGKGLVAAMIAETIGDKIDCITTNSGPNSGHIGYYKGAKIKTQQLPVAACVLAKMGMDTPTYLNAGALINPEILRTECAEYGVAVGIHPHAAIIEPEHLGGLEAIASTGKGTGPAAAAKVLRDPNAVADRHRSDLQGKVGRRRLTGRVFVETAQGYSLGINSGFYPYTTHRECTVGQALVDADIAPSQLRKSIAVVRTYPIRVGNSKGFSGPCYPDQDEFTWDGLGVSPELTTVTKRVRRVFTWSDQQFTDMLHSNRPNALHIGFLDYMAPEDVRPFMARLAQLYVRVMGVLPDFVTGSYGPTIDDTELLL